MKVSELIASLELLNLPNAEVVILYDDGCAHCGLEEVRLPDSTDYLGSYNDDGHVPVVLRTNQ